jgi:hypothetical protein
MKFVLYDKVIEAKNQLTKLVSFEKPVVQLTVHLCLKEKMGEVKLWKLYKIVEFSTLFS